MTRILMIDDNQELLEIMAESFGLIEADIEIDWTIDPEEGLLKALSGNYDMVIVNYRISATEVSIHESLDKHKIQYIVYTGDYATGLPAGKVCYKPSTSDDLWEFIQMKLALEA